MTNSPSTVNNFFDQERQRQAVALAGPNMDPAVCEGLFTLGSGVTLAGEKRLAFLAALHQAVQEKHIDLSGPNPVAGIEWETLVPGAEWEALGDTGEGTIKVTVEWRVSIAPLPEASDALGLLPS